MSEWISVEDDMPKMLPNRDYSGNVLTFDDYDEAIAIGCFSARDGWLDCNEPSHWMPLPEPPKEAE